MYLLVFRQGERQHTVGLFEKHTDATQWIESIPYVHKESETIEGREFISYTMNYDDILIYEEIEWEESRYPLSKYMFTPDDGKIELFIWDKLPVMNQVNGTVDGMTQVDAYMIPNPAVEHYIKQREAVRQAITTHYEQLGKEVKTGGLGSQDGEYVIIEDGPFVHLDANTVEQWENKSTVAQFIKQLED